MRTAKAWGYACGDFQLGSLSLPRDGVKKEHRAFTDDEVRRMMQAAPEPFVAVRGLRIGETLGLRVSDLNFAKRIVRVRQSVDSASRTISGVKSKASSADLPMSTELEARLRARLSRHDGKSELLFVNRRGQCSIRGWRFPDFGAKTIAPRRSAHHVGSLRTRSRRSTAHSGSKSQRAAGELGAIVRKSRFVRKTKNKQLSIN